jgi:hypothetical protein
VATIAALLQTYAANNNGFPRAPFTNYDASVQPVKDYLELSKSEMSRFNLDMSQNNPNNRWVHVSSNPNYMVSDGWYAEVNGPNYNLDRVAIFLRQRCRDPGTIPADDVPIHFEPGSGSQFAIVTKLESGGGIYFCQNY